ADAHRSLRSCTFGSSHASDMPQAIGAITQRLCQLIWRILHKRVRYEERGPVVSVEAEKVRARKMIRELRSLGYRVELLPAASSNPAGLEELFGTGSSGRPRESNPGSLSAEE